MLGKIYISKCIKKDVLFSRLSGPLDKTTPPAKLEFRNHVTKPIQDPAFCAEIEAHDDFGGKFWLSPGSVEENKIKKAVGTQYTDGAATTATSKPAITGASVVNQSTDDGATKAAKKKATAAKSAATKAKNKAKKKAKKKATG